MIKYLATDLDGTLLFPKSKDTYVCDNNKEILKLFNKNNILIVSGRNPKFIKKVCEELDIKESFVASNGASIYLNGKEIFLSCIKTSIVNKLINFVKNKYVDYTIVLFDSLDNIYSVCSNVKEATEKENQLKTKYPKLTSITNKDITQINELLNKEDSIVKVNFIISYDQRLEMYDFIKKENMKINPIICKNSLEIVNYGVDKGSSLLKLLDAMEINKDETCVVGDDNNDEVMLKHFKNSFLISNGTNKNLESSAKYILNKFTDLKNYLKEE